MAILDKIHALNAPDPALKSRFYVYVPDITDLYQCVVETIQPTFNKIPAKPRFTAGRNEYFPDNNDIDGLSITFYETFDFKVTAWLSRWRSKIVHPNSTYGLPKEYKRDILVHVYSYDSEHPLIIMKYIGCWPTDQNPFNLAYEDETGRLQVDAQFSVDGLELS